MAFLSPRILHLEEFELPHTIILASERKETVYLFSKNSIHLHRYPSHNERKEIVAIKLTAPPAPKDRVEIIVLHLFDDYTLTQSLSAKYWRKYKDEDQNPSPYPLSKKSIVTQYDGPMEELIDEYLLAISKISDYYSRIIGHL